MPEVDPADILARCTPEQIAQAILSLPPEMQAALAADAARKSFAEFVRQAWPIFEPAPLRWNWHVQVICDHLQEVAEGRIKRLIINIPPRHSKSNLFAIAWPAWVWVGQPQKQFLFLSYSSQLSVEHSVKCRAIIESPWYQESFAKPGGWRLRDDQNVKHDFVNTVGGRRRATSVTGGITGHGGDIIGIDDPLNADDAFSEAKRNEANRVIAEATTTRLNDAATGAVALIMQRLHEEDPTAFLLKSGVYEHLMLPTEFESARRAVTYHVVAGEDGQPGREEYWQDPRQEDGDLLTPDRFSREVVEAAKVSMGPDRFAGQHQQRPAPAGGGMFKVQNWRFWKHPGASDASAQRPTVDGVECYRGPAQPLDIEELDDALISVDATFKKTKSGSYVAIHVWGKKGARRCLLDRVHARMDFTETKEALLSVIARWPNVLRKLIEGKANGDAIISTLTAEHAITGIEPVNPGDASKEQRAYAMQPYQAAGNVELPDGAPWLPEYIAEHASFPNGGHDDDVDCQSQALQGFERAKTTFDEWGEGEL